MPLITEDDLDSDSHNSLRVSEPEALVLADRGFISLCPSCGNYHHEEYERWDEIREVLEALQRLPAVSDPVR